MSCHNVPGTLDKLLNKSQTPAFNLRRRSNRRYLRNILFALVSQILETLFRLTQQATYGDKTRRKLVLRSNLLIVQ